MKKTVAAKTAALFAASTLALALTGCVTNTEGAGHKSADTSSVQVSKKAQALVPKEIADKGVLVAGTDASYPPNEFKNSNGEITGWGVDLTEAIAAKLGLKVKWQEEGFDSIIPKITGGQINIGASSFTDNEEREKTVDFVNYYEAGVLWASPKGEKVDPNDACGLKVAVQDGTFEHTDELPAKRDECKAAGKPELKILPFEGQAEATNAVVLGQADAFSADSPVTLDALKVHGDKLEAAGEAFDVAPYGFTLKKDDELTKAVQIALQELIDDGTYMKILETAGVQAGAVKKATINAATQS